MAHLSYDDQQSLQRLGPGETGGVELVIELTDLDMVRVSTRVRSAIRDLRSAEALKAAEAKRLSDRVKGCEAEVDKLMEVIDTRHETQYVSCDARLVGTEVLYCRRDTGEQIHSRQARDSERQLDFQQQVQENNLGTELGLRYAYADLDDNLGVPIVLGGQWPTPLARFDIECKLGRVMSSAELAAATAAYLPIASMTRAQEPYFEWGKELGAIDLDIDDEEHTQGVLCTWSAELAERLSGCETPLSLNSAEPMLHELAPQLRSAVEAGYRLTACDRLEWAEREGRRSPAAHDGRTRVPHHQVVAPRESYVQADLADRWGRNLSVAEVAAYQRGFVAECSIPEPASPADVQPALERVPEAELEHVALEGKAAAVQWLATHGGDPRILTYTELEELVAATPEVEKRLARALTQPERDAYRIAWLAVVEPPVQAKEKKPRKKKEESKTPATALEK